MPKAPSPGGSPSSVSDSERRGRRGRALVDARAGRAHPRVGAVDVAVERQGEQAGVQIVAVEEARVAAEPLVVPAGLDLGPDGVPLGAKPVARRSAVGRPRAARSGGRARPSRAPSSGCDGSGRHVPPRSLRPARASAGRPCGRARQQARRVAIEAPAAGSEPRHGVNHLAVDVELELPVRVVADADWPRAGVAREVRQLRSGRWASPKTS